MKVRSLLFTLITIVLCSCGGHDTIENPIVGNSIEVISIDPAPNSKLNESSIISARLKYTIDPAEKSDYGFKIMIQFTKPGDTTSYSFQPNSIDLNSYSGTVILDHAILKEWNDVDTRHPIQCHFDLLKRTSLTTGHALAETPNIDYSE